MGHRAAQDDMVNTVLDRTETGTLTPRTFSPKSVTIPTTLSRLVFTLIVAAPINRNPELGKLTIIHISNFDGHRCNPQETLHIKAAKLLDHQIFILM
jgi:hypothetical protein